MTTLRREAIQLIEQMPEEQMAHIIRYIRKLRDKEEVLSDDEHITTPQMQAFLEMEKMIVPVSNDLDYDKELAEARDERYGYIN